MRVRVLNRQGTEAFAAWFENLKDAPASTPPRHLLTDEHCLESSTPETDIELRTMGSKLELAKYLDNHIGALLPNHDCPGLWNWLSLAFFDTICARTGGAYTPLSMPFYILRDGAHFGDTYRHLIAGPMWLYRLDSVVAEALLSTAATRHPEAIDQFLMRPTWARIPGFRRTFLHLYFTRATGEWARKRGAFSKRRPGNVRRFGKIMYQLDLTYDVASLDSAAMLRLLPAEFDGFRG